MKRVLLTGAGGFIGRRFLERGENEDIDILRVLRNSDGKPAVITREIAPLTDWSSALNNIDCVVHLAARVHVMKDSEIDPLAKFRYVNVDGTLNLARQAASMGVRRFIFISSIKVNGEVSPLNKPFTAETKPMPADAYGLTKLEAENGLFQITKQTGMEVVCIRPPLVYGPGVKANFLNMMHWLDKGIPLPFGAIHNKRSLVALDNLVDLIITCIDHPAAANQVFLVSDGEDLSTTELLQRTAIAMGKKAILLPVPATLLRIGANIFGKREIAQRLLDSLQVDIGKTREMLGWTPPLSVNDGLKLTADAFLHSIRT